MARPQKEIYIMLIAHISDFHVFSSQPETRQVRLDIADVARRVVQDLANFTPALDAIAFTGDLTDGGSQEDYALLKEILSPLQVPVFMVPGNHDKRRTLRAAFADTLPFEDGPFLNYETRAGGLRVLALDTLIEGRGEGALAPESLAWLVGRLTSATPEPTLVLLHHPPFPSGMASLDNAALTEGCDALAAMVREYPERLIILAGHIHRPYQSIWNGAYCAVGGSPAFQVALDLKADRHEPPCISQAYAYYVYRIDREGEFAVHTRFVSLDR